MRCESGSDMKRARYPTYMYNYVKYDGENIYTLGYSDGLGENEYLPTIVSFLKR